MNIKEFDVICDNSVSILFERLNRGDEYYSFISMNFNSLIIIFEDSIVYEIHNDKESRSFVVSYYYGLGINNRRIFYIIKDEEQILDIRRKSKREMVLNIKTFVLDKVQTIYRKQYIKNILKDA